MCLQEKCLQDKYLQEKCLQEKCLQVKCLRKNCLQEKCLQDVMERNIFECLVIQYPSRNWMIWYQNAPMCSAVHHTSGKNIGFQWGASWPIVWHFKITRHWNGVKWTHWHDNDKFAKLELACNFSNKVQIRMKLPK